MMWQIKVYTAGWNEGKQLHLFDQYSSNSGTKTLGNQLDMLIASAESDGMKIEDIVITEMS